jgi:hypothetical protein
MPELSSRTLFSGAEDICPNDLGCTEVSNFNTNVDAQAEEPLQMEGEGHRHNRPLALAGQRQGRRRDAHHVGPHQPQGDQAGLLCSVAGRSPGLLPRPELPHRRHLQVSDHN